MNIKSSITMLALCLALTSVAQANSTASDQEKLDFIASNFNTIATHSRYWQNGWLTLFSGSALVHAGIWDQTGSQKERFNAKVTVITSTLGAADMLINPMKSHKYAEQLSEANVSLSQAESWLEAAAKREQYERSLTNHLLSGLVNGLAGLAVAKDSDSNSDGVMTFLSGMIATEVKIFTSPTHMTEAWQAYQQGNLSSLADQSAKSRWFVTAAGPVLQVQYQF